MDRASSRDPLIWDKSYVSRRLTCLKTEVSAILEDCMIAILRHEIHIEILLRYEVLIIEILLRYEGHEIRYTNMINKLLDE